MGYDSTLAYVAAAAKAVLLETGLLPHVNAGVMGIEDIRMLQRVSVGQGLMLESASARLLEPGGPHHNCPDKVAEKLGPVPNGTHEILSVWLVEPAHGSFAGPDIGCVQKPAWHARSDSLNRQCGEQQILV